MEKDIEKKEKLINNVNSIISRIENKDFNIYFYCSDKVDAPIASNQQIFEHVKILNNNGYKAFVLYDSDTFPLPGKWFDGYKDLPTVSITKKVIKRDPKTKKDITVLEPTNLKISNIDYLILPEAYANIMQQLSSDKTKVNCNKVVFCQNYCFISEILPLHKSWDVYGFTKAITTSEELKNFITEISPVTKTQVTPIIFNDEKLKKSDKPLKPYIAFITREQTDYKIITNKFYKKYPAFRWFTPLDLRGLEQDQYFDTLKQCCVLVWVDKRSSYGTAPLEAMKFGVPTIGLVPDLIVDWMKKEGEEITLNENVIWSGSVLEIPDILSNYCTAYLEDTLPEEMFIAMDKTINKLGTTKEQESNVCKIYEDMFYDKKEEFKEILSKNI